MQTQINKRIPVAKDAEYNQIVDQADQTEDCDENQHLTTENEINFTKNLEKRRYLILIMFFMFALTNSIAWCTFQGILTQGGKYYNVQSRDMIWFTNAYLLTYLILSYFSMIVGTGLNCLGCWIRYLAKDNFHLAVAGQVVTGLAQTFTLPAPVFVANRFFSAAEKFGVITICIQSDYLGNAFGYLYPTWAVQDDSNAVPMLLFQQAILLTLPFILCLFVIKEKPDKPPNNYFEENHESFLVQLKRLLTPKFLIPLIGFSVCFSLSQTVPSVIDYLLEPLNYSPLKIGTIGLVYSASGMITGTLSTIIIAKYTNPFVFKKLIQLLIILSFIALACFAKFITIQNFLLTNIIVAFAGIGIIGILPFACQYLEEISYPVNENISINTFIFVSALLSLIMTEVSTSDFVGDKGVYVLFFIIIPPTIYFLFYFKLQSKNQVKQISNI